MGLLDQATRIAVQNAQARQWQANSPGSTLYSLPDGTLGLRLASRPGSLPTPAPVAAPVALPANTIPDTVEPVQAVVSLGSVQEPTVFIADNSYLDTYGPLKENALSGANRSNTKNARGSIRVYRVLTGPKPKKRKAPKRKSAKR